MSAPIGGLHQDCAVCASLEEVQRRPAPEARTGRPRRLLLARFGQFFKRGDSFNKVLKENNKALDLLLQQGEMLSDRLCVLGQQLGVDLVHDSSCSSAGCGAPEATARQTPPGSAVSYGDRVLAQLADDVAAIRKHLERSTPKRSRR